MTTLGFAYSGGGRDIVRVDVSVDEGQTWHNATLNKVVTTTFVTPYPFPPTLPRPDTDNTDTLPASLSLLASRYL